jgi:hypothetical protein
MPTDHRSDEAAEGLAMAPDDREPGKFTPWDQQPQDLRWIKYAALTVIFCALALYRALDRITPTRVVLTVVPCVLAGFFAWAFEASRGFKLDWFFSFVLYMVALVVAAGLLFLGIYIFTSM